MDIRAAITLIESAHEDGLLEGVRDRVWFHGTPREFGAFSNAYTTGQLGIHLGSTRDQALWRIAETGGFLLHVRANVSNLLRLKDEGSWYGEAFAEQLRSNPKTSHLKWRGSMSDRAISSALATLGFDGILYVNKFEGEQPAPSIIVFDAGRLTIVDREIVPPQNPD